MTFRTRGHKFELIEGSFGYFNLSFSFQGRRDSILFTVEELKENAHVNFINWVTRSTKIYV